MGVRQGIGKTKEENLVIPYPKFINKRAEILVDSGDFITQNIKQFALKICDKINLEKDYFEETEKEQIISKFEYAIKYDNTNENILQKYFNALKKFNYEETLKNNLERYFYHISPEIYKNILNIEKKNTSIDKLKEIFNLFENYNYTCYATNDIISYFCSKKIKVIDTNLNYNIKTNKELSLIDIYYSLYSKMEDKIKDILWKIKNSKLTIPEKIKLYCSESDQKEVNELLKLNIYPEDIPNIFLTYYYKFLFILEEINNYIVSIKPVLTECLEFKNLEMDYYILLLISLEIEYIIQFKEKPKYKDEILEYIKKEQIINKNNIINFTKYKSDKLSSKVIKKLKKIKENKKKYVLIPYLKLQYSNKNNYIHYNLEFIKQFNKKVSKSITISSLLNYLYPGYKEINLFEGEFMDILFENAIDNCYFYPFFYKKVGAYTLNRNNQLIFFIPNRSKIDEDLLDLPQNYYQYLISNLGTFIYIEYQELFGHYLRALLSKITEMDYQSPRSTISSRNESGECIELLLFGNRIKFFNIKQMIYILDINNYTQNFNKFRDNFMNIKNYFPSKGCKELLLEIGINLNEININDDSSLAALFGFNESIYYENDENIELPFLEDCTDNIYEINNLDNTYINKHCESLKRLFDLRKNQIY